MWGGVQCGILGEFCEGCGGRSHQLQEGGDAEEQGPTAEGHCAGTGGLQVQHEERLRAVAHHRLVLPPH